MALRAGRVGVNPADVDAITGHITTAGGSSYSEEETVIGTWVDGITPIYRKVIQCKGPTATETASIIDPFNNVGKHIINFHGYTQGAITFPINFYGSATNYAYTTIRENGISMVTLTGAIVNADIIIVVEYTKED